LFFILFRYLQYLAAIIISIVLRCTALHSRSNTWDDYRNTKSFLDFSGQLSANALQLKILGNIFVLMILESTAEEPLFLTFLFGN
jgi:hypothetical protein